MLHEGGASRINGLTDSWGNSVLIKVLHLMANDELATSDNGTLKFASRDVSRPLVFSFWQLKNFFRNPSR